MSSTRSIVGGIGAGALLLGCILPFTVIPGLGSSSLLGNSISGFLIVFPLAWLTIYLLVSQKYEWLWFSGGGAMVATAISVWSVRESIQNFGGGFGPGGFVLVIGCVLVLASAAMKVRGGDPTHAFNPARIGNAGAVIAKNFDRHDGVFHDVRLSPDLSDDKIDVVVCTLTGVYPILVKNFKGSLTAESDTVWIQEFQGVQVRIPNPLIEIVGLSKQLASRIGAKEEWVCPMVALVGDPDIAFALPEGVLSLADAIMEIKSSTKARYHNGTKKLIERKLSNLS